MRAGTGSKVVWIVNARPLSRASSHVKCGPELHLRPASKTRRINDVLFFFLLLHLNVVLFLIMLLLLGERGGPSG